MDSGREQSEQRFEWLKQTMEPEGAGCRTRDSDGEGKNEKAHEIKRCLFQDSELSRWS